MRILVLNRSEVGNFTAKVPYAVVSIKDPGEETVQLVPSVYLRDVLQLSFHDLTKQLGKGGYKLFDAVMAEQVCRFTKRCLLNIELLVIHCGAGKSRSAAIAAALNKWINGSHEPYVRGKSYIPNPLVLSVMEAELDKVAANE
ncbi:MAG: hypothetical protein WD970_01010 [Patescibacteria group bacterium]